VNSWLRVAMIFWTKFHLRKSRRSCSACPIAKGLCSWRLWRQEGWRSLCWTRMTCSCSILDSRFVTFTFCIFLFLSSESRRVVVDLLLLLAVIYYYYYYYYYYYLLLCRRRLFSHSLDLRLDWRRCQCEWAQGQSRRGTELFEVVRPSCLPADLQGAGEVADCDVRCCIRLTCECMLLFVVDWLNCNVRILVLFHYHALFILFLIC
jgi:hypothetical protein